MGTDRVRRSYDASRMYRSIVSQQGRVTVDVDSNETDELRRAETRDLDADGTDGSGTSRVRGIALAIGGGVVVAGLVSLLLINASHDGGDNHAQRLATQAGAASASTSTPGGSKTGGMIGDPSALAAGPPTSASDQVTTVAGSLKRQRETSGTATTVRPPSGSASTSTSATTGAGGTATTAGPPADPVVGAMSTKPSEIWESSAKGNCASTNTTTVSVTVSDSTGVQSVTLYWSVNGNQGSVEMNRAGASETYEAVLGSFKPGTATSKGQTIDLTAKAIDKGGRTASATSTVFLHSASEC